MQGEENWKVNQELWFLFLINKEAFEKNKKEFRSVAKI